MLHKANKHIHMCTVHICVTQRHTHTQILIYALSPIKFINNAHICVFLYAKPISQHGHYIECIKHCVTLVYNVHMSRNASDYG